MNRRDDMTKAETVARGRRVLSVEAAALADFAARLDGAFAEAVAMLEGVTGRVVVCGMGKSGHVARKIAATLASTGSPAQFLHPAEASHGDLGMLTRGDAALVLSYSGETAELADVIAHTRRFSIPLIGVMARADSALARACDVAILLPQVEEACPAGLAPTTSTTLTMALGDALAVALMERRGFDADTFRALHPRGALGARLVKVADVMHRGPELPLVAAEAPMREVLLEMTSKGFGIAGVVADGALTGVITDGDLRRNMERLMTACAGDVATRDPLTIGPAALIDEALALLNNPERPATCLFVVDPDDPARAPLGVAHLHDFLRAGAR